MKELLKKLLKWLNNESVSVFARFHFRKQAKEYCEKNNMTRADAIRKALGLLLDT